MSLKAGTLKKPLKRAEMFTYFKRGESGRFPLFFI